MHDSPAAHACPHIPQFVALDDGSIHVPPQSICAAPHIMEARQVPIAHVCPVVHAVVQEPQCVGSAKSETHAPPQLVCPVGHIDECSQRAARHVSPAAQGTAHPPQFIGSAAKFAHTPSHNVKFAGQVMSPLASRRMCPESITGGSPIAHAASMQAAIVRNDQGERAPVCIDFILVGVRRPVARRDQIASLRQDCVLPRIRAARRIDHDLMNVMRKESRVPRIAPRDFSRHEQIDVMSVDRTAAIDCHEAPVVM